MIHIAIVEDSDTIRQTLSNLIETTTDMQCTGAFSNAEDAMRAVSKDCMPHVVLMDIELPGISGIDAVKILKERCPAIEIMMLTIFEDSDSVFSSLSAGASGYLLKNAPADELLESIRQVCDGGSPMSYGIARKVIQSFHKPLPSPQVTFNLTDRENEVLIFLTKGYRYQEIADRVFVSVDTIRKHVHNIYAKLHVRSRAEAMVKINER